MLRKRCLAWAAVLFVAVPGCGNDGSGMDASDAPGGNASGTDAGARSNLPPEGVPLGDPWSAESGQADSLPDRVPIKTNTESYNRRYYFAVRDGGIWLKPNVERTGEDGPWQALSLPPEIDGRIFEISADDNEMIGLTDDREIWTMTGALMDRSTFSWTSNWGFPFWTGPGQSLPDWTYRWEWSVISPQEDVFWTDPAGNEQPVGAAKVSHIWILPEDQHRLTYIDPWLPLDFSYGMCGPERDRFRAENLTASGSTIFVINRYGDMFTRLFDFDISGADNAFFQYSYEDQRDASGAPPIQLPSPDWVEHPKIDGEITNLISIHKVGEGGIHRTMRVEGVGPGGEAGYFEKDVTDLDTADWVFHETGQPLRGIPLENSLEDRSDENLAPSSDIRFERNLDRLDELGSAETIASAEDWAAALTTFNVYCNRTTLRVFVSGDVTFDLTLHTADTIRGDPRAAGLDDSPRDFNATIEVPAALLGDLASRPAKVRDFVEQYLGASRFTEVGLHATVDELVICLSGATFDRSCAVEPWRFSRAD